MDGKKVAIYAVLSTAAAGLSLMQIVQKLPHPQPPPLVHPVLEHPDYHLTAPKAALGRLKP